MNFNKLFFRHFIYYPVCYLKLLNIIKDKNILNYSQYYNINELEKLQFIKLKNLLENAKKNVPYYKSILKCNNPGKSLNEYLSYLPFLDKKMIQGNIDIFKSRKKSIGSNKKTTAGSTGEPFIIYKDRKAMSKELAAMWRGYQWAGVEIGDKQGRFWGVPLKKKDKLKAMLIDFVANRKRCSGFGFDKQKMRQYTEELIKFKPSYFYGYVSMIKEYALYFKNNQIRSPFNLKCIITTSELLSKTDRNLIEEVFRVKVYNEYGSGEIGSIAHECEEGSLHISAENMIVEIINSSNERCMEGEVGEIVVTELNNRLMPLIRYRTGDMASYSGRACNCGRAIPVIENLSGRYWDMIQHKDGRKFHPVIFLYIFEEVKNKEYGVDHYRVKQTNYNSFEIEIVPNAKYSRITEQFIIEKFKSIFDKNAIIKFNLVDCIKREKSGKLRQVIGMNS